MARPPPEQEGNPALVVVGTARLPQSLASHQSLALFIELELEPCDGHIQGIATSIGLPGYNALLRQLFIGQRLDELQGAMDQFRDRYRGPLLKPTIAALANAVNNGKPQP